jgi:hypothetical protein
MTASRSTHADRRRRKLATPLGREPSTVTLACGHETGAGPVVTDPGDGHRKSLYRCPRGCGLRRKR